MNSGSEPGIVITFGPAPYNKGPADGDALHGCLAGAHGRCLGIIDNGPAFKLTKHLHSVGKSFERIHGPRQRFVIGFKAHGTEERTRYQHGGHGVLHVMHTRDCHPVCFKQGKMASPFPDIHNAVTVTGISFAAC